MVVKTIVVRNLFSFEYEGSNPSLPTKIQGVRILPCPPKYKANLYFILKQIYKHNFGKVGRIIKFNTNKEKGNTGLGITIAYFTANGYTVSIPLNDTQDYDLVIDKNNELETVQVKATGCKTKMEIIK